MIFVFFESFARERRMGDKRRFNVLADFIAERVPRMARIADIAAGKGHLSLALRERGFLNVVAFEPAPRGATSAVAHLPLRAQPFDMDDAQDFDVLVGLHPDQATEEIVCGAGRHDVRMFLLPCCIKPTRSVMWQPHNSRGWIEHLLLLAHKHGLRPERTSLPINGRNVLLWT